VLGAIEKPLTPEKLQAVLARSGESLFDGDGEEDVAVDTTQLRDALRRGEILPWFQPQAGIRDGRIVGAEALVRWRRGDGRMVQPQHFVHLLEEEGLAEPLADLMLEAACRWKKRWEEAGVRLKASVNISPLVLHDAGAPDRYQQLARDLGVDPAEVVLEITEGSLMSDAARGLGVLARLRLKGFGLSIDDFGTGYSSLAQLSQVPFTELKIDQGFVSGAHAQPRKRAVVEASLDLARKLQLDTVAEGVATIEDWQLLARLGCDVAQGYLVSRPVPGEDVVAAVAAWHGPPA
jgi:EAL domain-containing protein (putative c-di-GMP-specific phosphodiesterase class I)